MQKDWTAVYRDALTREPDPRALDALAGGLAEGAPRELDRFVDGLLTQPHRQPAAFAWLAERAAVAVHAPSARMSLEVAVSKLQALQDAAGRMRGLL